MRMSWTFFSEEGVVDRADVGEDLFDLFLTDGVIDFADEGDLLLAFARTLGAQTDDVIEEGDVLEVVLDLVGEDVLAVGENDGVF